MISVSRVAIIAAKMTARGANKNSWMSNKTRFALNAVENLVNLDCHREITNGFTVKSRGVWLNAALGLCSRGSCTIGNRINPDFHAGG